MKVLVVTVSAQLLGDEFTGGMEVGHIVVERPPQHAINAVGKASSVGQVHVVGDVLRLDVETRGDGNTGMLRHVFGTSPQWRRHDDMHEVSLGYR